MNCWSIIWVLGSTTITTAGATITIRLTLEVISYKPYTVEQNQYDFPSVILCKTKSVYYLMS